MEQERCDDTEVAATTAYCPEQVGVLLGAGCNEAAIGEYHVDAEQVVNRQAQCTREVADASAQRQPTNAGGGNKATRRSQPEGMRGMVHVAPGAATFHTSGTCSRIDANPLHVREVDHQAVVAGAQAGAIVPATTDSQCQLVVARKIDRSDHIGDIHAAGDQRGLLVDHGIIDLASLRIVSIAGTKQRTTQVCCKPLDSRLFQSDCCVLLFHHTFLLVRAISEVVHAMDNVPNRMLPQ